MEVKLETKSGPEDSQKSQSQKAGFGKGMFFSGKRKGKTEDEFAKCNGSCHNGSCK